MSLAKQYDALRRPGQNRLRQAHDELDSAVFKAYGFGADDEPLAQLLALNQDILADPGHARGPGSDGFDGVLKTTYRLTAPEL